MDRITRTELQMLAAPADEPRVSIYLPLERTYAEARHNPLLLRSALDDAFHQLEAQGVGRVDAVQLLKPVRQYEADLSRSSGVEGLAVLFSPSLVRIVRLPYRCPKSVDVGTSFHLAPLMRMLTWPVEFLLLALSANTVRVYRGTREELVPIELPGSVPQGVSDFLMGTEIGRPLRFQTAVGTGPTGGPTMVVHGPMSYEDDMKLCLHEYVRTVAREIGRVVACETIPLVLAAVEPLHPVFREAYAGPDLVEPGVQGSPDELTEFEMREKAVELVEAGHQEEIRAACERFEGVAHAVCGLEEIVPAAHHGRVDSIFAAFGERVWGTWDAETGVVMIGPRGQSDRIDLLDLALRASLRHGGHVYVVPREHVPGGGSATVLLRW